MHDSGEEERQNESMRGSNRKSYYPVPLLHYDHEGEKNIYGKNVP
jgi:hypothetical protein